jgi:RNA polymerase sigma-54 factor
MQLDMNINIEQKRNLVMTPQLQMAIKILQYSSLELKEHIEKNIEENPLLDILDPEKISVILSNSDRKISREIS